MAGKALFQMHLGQAPLQPHRLDGVQGAEEKEGDGMGN